MLSMICYRCCQPCAVHALGASALSMPSMLSMLCLPCYQPYAVNAVNVSALSMPSMLSMLYSMLSIQNYTRTAGNYYKHVACLGPLGLGSRLWRGLVEMLPRLSIWRGLSIPPGRLPPLRLPARLPPLGRLGLHVGLPHRPWTNI